MDHIFLFLFYKKKKSPRKDERFDLYLPFRVLWHLLEKVIFKGCRADHRVLFPPRLS